MDVQAAPGREVPHRPRADRGRAKAAIERTIKLNEGAAYNWGAVKSIDTPDATALVFKLKYAAPLDIISSAATPPTSSTPRPRVEAR